MTSFCELEKRGHVFFLTLTGADENDEHRLNPDAIESLKAALRKAKSEAVRGSVLITTARGKFFCNGFDLAWAQAAGSAIGVKERLVKMVEYFKPVLAELVSLPMPAIAAVNGHAAAAGFALAMCHDYVLMRGDKGVLYMSELDIGMTFPDYFVALMRSKLGGSPSALRNVMLKGTKMKAAEAVKLGIVESAHDDAESTMDAAESLAGQLGGRKWDGEVYSEIRKSMYPEICGALGLSSRAVFAPRSVK